MGTTHHDSELVLVSDVEEVFKVLTDDVGLFVEVTIGSIYYVSRCQTTVNPLALFTAASETARVKATTS